MSSHIFTSIDLFAFTVPIYFSNLWTASVVVVVVVPNSHAGIFILAFLSVYLFLFNWPFPFPFIRIHSHGHGPKSYFATLASPFSLSFSVVYVLNVS